MHNNISAITSLYFKIAQVTITHKYKKIILLRIIFFHSIVDKIILPYSLDEVAMFGCESLSTMYNK